MILSKKEVINNLITSLKDGSIDVQEAEWDGQLVVLTGMFLWGDGSIHNKQEFLHIEDNT
jgi:hypothetical protein